MSTDQHQGLPVAGYQPQSSARVDLVNQNKEIEERVLRILDSLFARTDTDKRHLSIARTHIEDGFMWMNRAVFQPGRVALPEDASPSDNQGA